jgi:hypothetical protein
MVTLARRLGGAAVVACLALLLSVPAGAQAFEKAILGPESRDGVTAFPLYHDLGVKVLQTTLNWSEVAKTRPADPTNPNDPAYVWPTSLDQLAGEAQANGVQLLFIAMFTPSWANGKSDPAYAPNNPQDYADFLVAASRHYTTVKRWMIWGEPCEAIHFKPLTFQKYLHPLTSEQKGTVRRYARLLDAAYAGLKSVDPNNVVIGGDTWSFCDIRPLDWVQNMRLPNGKAPRMDWYGHNPIGLVKRKNKPDPRLHQVELPDLPRLQQYIDRYLGRGRPRIKLWLSEYFLPTLGNPATNFVVPPAQQGRILAEAFRIARRMPTVVGFGYDYVFDTHDNGNAGLISRSGQKKAAYFAFKRG